MIIAIDGPAGSGKSTISKRVADKLNYYYLDTGAMYRAITYSVMNAGIDLEDTQAIIKIAKGSIIEFIGTGTHKQKVILNGNNVTREIRVPEVTNNVKFIAKIPDIREQLVSLQRKLAHNKDVVIEGRDTTTVVFPNADFKIYLDASQRERAQRRYIELQEKGLSVTFEEILDDQKKRDESDFTRAVGPLKIAHGANVLDTSKMSIDDVVERIVFLVKGKARDWRFTYFIGKSLCTLFGKILFGLKIHGQENVPRAGGFLLAANHSSFVDPAVAGCMLKRHVHFFARDSLFKVPVLGPVLPFVNCHQIKRGTADKGALSLAENLVKSGKGVVLFPEGTRSVDGSIRDVKFGIGFIAVHSAVPVVPCYIHNAYNAWSKGSKKINRVPIDVYYGKPLFFSLPRVKTDRKSREIYQEATNSIMDAIRALREEVLKNENSSS